MVFLLCRSTELLSTCNTQPGLRDPGSLQDSVQLVLGHEVSYWNGHSLPFSTYVAQQSETRAVTSKGSLVGWHSTFVWLHVLAEWLYRRMWCLFAPHHCSSFPFFCGMILFLFFLFDYLPHRCMVAQYSLLTQPFLVQCNGALVSSYERKLHVNKMDILHKVSGWRWMLLIDPYECKLESATNRIVWDPATHLQCTVSITKILHRQ